MVIDFGELSRDFCRISDDSRLSDCSGVTRPAVIAVAEDDDTDIGS